MKINILHILKEIPLADYNAGMAPAVVLVWVNPPRKFMQRRATAMRELDARKLMARKKSESGDGFVVDPVALEKLVTEFNQTMMQWYSELLSKGEDPESHWSPEELAELSENEPSLHMWLIKQVERNIRDHRDGAKKK